MTVIRYVLSLIIIGTILVLICLNFQRKHESWIIFNEAQGLSVTSVFSKHTMPLVEFNGFSSPDGTQIAYISSHETPNREQLYLYDIRTNTTQRISDLAGRNYHKISDIQWSPNGKFLAYFVYINDFLGRIYTFEFSTSETQTIASEGAIGLGSWQGDQVYWIKAIHAPGGSQATEHELMRGSKTITIDSTSRFLGDVLWIPQQQLLAYVDYSTVPQRYSIKIRHLNGNIDTIYEAENRIIYSLESSPDGEWIVFDTQYSPFLQFLQPICGFIPPCQPPPPPPPPEDNIIYRVRPNGSDLQELAIFNGNQPSYLKWSPDGELISYNSYPNAYTNNILVMTANGKPVTSIPNASNGQWTPQIGQKSHRTRLRIWAIRSGIIGLFALGAFEHAIRKHHPKHLA